MTNKPAFYADMTPMLLGVCVFASLGSLSFGYDNGWFGFILGAPYFNSKFGSQTTATGSKVLSATDQSLSTALGTAGIMIGCMFSPFLNERFGRKKSFILLGGIGVIGALVQALSTIGHRLSVFIAGKIILNISVGIASSVVPVYLSEAAPKNLRGVLASIYVVIQNVGYVTAAISVYFVVERRDSGNWLVPICVQFFVPMVIIIGGPWLVESPRWLISKNRLEEATHVVAVLRGKTATDTSVIAEEVDEIRASWEEQRDVHAGTGWSTLFKGPNLRRTGIAVGLQCLQQAQGVGFVSNYLVVTFISLGITNVYLVVLCIYLCLFFSSLLNFYVPDRFGRRALLLFGSTVQTICMLTVGIISTVTSMPTGNLANLLIASFFIWVSVFSYTWSSLPWIMCGEVPSSTLREKTVALASWSGFGVGLAVGFIVPYIQGAAYGNMGGKIAYIWAAFSVLSGLYAFFVVPELKGRSLEELDYMFELGISARSFGSYDTSELLATKAAQHEQGRDIRAKTEKIEHDEHIERP